MLHLVTCVTALMDELGEPAFSVGLRISPSDVFYASRLLLSLCEGFREAVQPVRQQLISGSGLLMSAARWWVAAGWAESSAPSVRPHCARPD